jgi:hypothetical protein
MRWTPARASSRRKPKRSTKPACWAVTRALPCTSLRFFRRTPLDRWAELPWWMARTQTGSSILTKGWTNAVASRLKKDDIVTFAGCYAVNPTTRASTGALRQFTVTADFSSDVSGGGDQHFARDRDHGALPELLRFPHGQRRDPDICGRSRPSEQGDPAGPPVPQGSIRLGHADQPVPTGAVIFAKRSATRGCL